MNQHKKLARDENGYAVDVSNSQQPVIYIDRTKLRVERDTAQSDESFEVIRLVPKVEGETK